jgi:hypothetical protein
MTMVHVANCARMIVIVEVYALIAAKLMNARRYLIMVHVANSTNQCTSTSCGESCFDDSDCGGDCTYCITGSSDYNDTNGYCM